MSDQSEPSRAPQIGGARRTNEDLTSNEPALSLERLLPGFRDSFTSEDRATRTLAKSENTALTADINVPANLNPPEVMALGGVGYIAGDLNIICA